MTQAEPTVSINILSENGELPENVVRATLEKIPVSFLKDEAVIFTRIADPRNPNRVTGEGKGLDTDGYCCAEDLILKYADIFTGSLSEVIPVPGAQHQLNIPDRMMFNLRVNQRALTPPQTQFLHRRIDEMLTAGIIE
ncbi:hypothetical protein P692DRAFT_20747746, partial [Suillus brevipes Sb2]